MLVSVIFLLEMALIDEKNFMEEISRIFFAYNDQEKKNLNYQFVCQGTLEKNIQSE